MNKIICIFICLVVSSVGYSQEEATDGNHEFNAKIHLNSGSILEVDILEWREGEGVEVMTSWGQQIFFKQDRIRKVITFTHDNRNLNRNYIFRERGLYYYLRAGMILSNNGVRLGESNGYGASFTTGYRLNRWVGLGVGVGFDQFAHGSGEKTIPLFVDFTSYLIPANTSLVFNIQAGYSLGFADEENGISEANGGWMIYPNIGLSFGSSVYKYTFDIGYKFQQADWTYTSRWDGRDRTEFDMLYKRLAVRFGILL